MGNDTARLAAARRHLAIVLVAVLCGGIAMVSSGLISAEGANFPAATPRARCGPGSMPETGVQGRVPASDYESGRAAKGYYCNAAEVGHQGSTGGFKVHRHVDKQGHQCAYYDSTRAFPSDLVEQFRDGLGVVVLDMDHPAKPRRTAMLTTPAMLSPHESLVLNKKRGLLAAVMGTAFAGPGILEIYDVGTDCRHPKLLSSSPVAILGHESGWSPDGKTLYATSSGAQTFVAIDTTNPRAPRRIFQQFNVNYHGLRVSDDGRTLFVAHIGNDLSEGTLPGEGLRILDVSEIQARKPNPRVRILSNLTWREGSIPQVAQPFTRDGRDYVLQVDEFSKYGIQGDGSVDASKAVVGAARIIDVTNLRRPVVVSNLRLGVQQPKARLQAAGDPGASSPVGGYTGHYCSIPYREEPRIAACSMIGSGLRVFDISDLAHPREAAYFNRPTSEGSIAMSQPAWDHRNRTIWYTDGASGFYAVKLTNGVGKLIRRRSSPE